MQAYQRNSGILQARQIFSKPLFSNRIDSSVGEPISKVIRTISLLLPFLHIPQSAIYSGCFSVAVTFVLVWRGNNIMVSIGTTTGARANCCVSTTRTTGSAHAERACFNALYQPMRTAMEIVTPFGQTHPPLWIIQRCSTLAPALIVLFVVMLGLL